MKLSEVTADVFEFIIDRAEPQKQGIYVYYKGVPYPRRVYYNPNNDPNFFLRVLSALGTVKKTFFALTYLPSVVLPYRFSFKKYEGFLIKLLAVADWNLNEFYLKDNEYSQPVWEIGKFICHFLNNLGLSAKTSKGYAKVGMMILEFDNAYRFRLQDILGETTKELLQNPRVELNRLLKIYLSRELQQPNDLEFGARPKVVKAIKIFRFLLLLPKVKKVFFKALKITDLGAIALDINDRYYVSFWQGYDFFGQDFDKRYQFFLDTHKGNYPPYRKRQSDKQIAEFMTG